jgi:hypothetical protein
VCGTRAVRRLSLDLARKGKPATVAEATAADKAP